MNHGSFLSFYAAVLFFSMNCFYFVNSTTPLVPNINTKDAASIDKEIAISLIRDTAEKEREDIRSTIQTELTNYNPFKKRNIHHDNVHFTRWETLMADTSRQEQPVWDSRDVGRTMLLMKITEGVWKSYFEYQSNSKENERITFKEFTSRRSDFTIENRQDPHSGQRHVFVYTSKAAYYRFQHDSRIQFYNKTMESFMKKIEEVNEWEQDMLSALDLNYGTTSHTIVPQMIGNLLKTWESKVVNNLKKENECGSTMVCPEKPPILTTETPKDEEKNLNGNEQKPKDKEQNPKDVNGNGKQYDEEIAVFLSLYDKHGHLLETILAQRELKKE